MDKRTSTAAQSASVLHLHSQGEEAPAVRAIYRASEHMPAYAVEHRADGVSVIPATDIDGAIGIPDDEGVPLATWLADGAKGAVLYRRPELVAARGEDRSRYVYVVGTEATADRLRLEGAVATTCAGGLTAWRDTYARQLTGRHIVLVVKARGATSDRVAESLTPHAASVSVLEMAQTGEQFFASGRSVADLDALVLRAHRVSDAGDWSTPVSLAESPVPRFPVEVLPGWLRDVVEDVAHAVQVPVCFPAAHVLGALATAAGGQVGVRLPTGFQMPVALWVILVAEPGTRKSSAHSYATTPLIELSDRLADLTAQARREAKAVRITAEQGLKDAEQQLRSAVGDEETAAAKAVYVQALAVPDDPVGTRQIWAENRLESTLQRNSERLVTLGVALHEAIVDRLPTGEPVDRPALSLSPAASAAARVWLEDKERRLAPKGDLRPLRGWVAKADGSSFVSRHFCTWRNGRTPHWTAAASLKRQPAPLSLSVTT